MGVDIETLKPGDGSNFPRYTFKFCSLTKKSVLDNFITGFSLLSLNLSKSINKSKNLHHLISVGLENKILEQGVEIHPHGWVYPRLSSLYSTINWVWL